MLLEKKVILQNHFTKIEIHEQKTPQSITTSYCI